MIIEPSGKVMKLGGREEEILVGEFDMQALRRHRAGGIYGRHHRRPVAYGPLLKD